MKPLLSKKVKRGEKLDEWEPSEHQSTLDGLRAFEQRQKRRLAEAQGKQGTITELRRKP